MIGLGIAGLVDVRFLAAGGFGNVYVARQDGLDRDVAVKVLAAPLIDEQARMRFQRERRALGALSEHPNIVSLYDAGYADDGRPYLLMPYLRAGSLDDVLSREGRLGALRVAEIGTKVAGALQTAHAAHILHRDVKPANILLSDYGEPQLADFGIAKFHDTSKTSSGVLTGTLVFTAPELFAGHPPTPASDVYALAATLYALLEGVPPYLDGDASPVAIIARATSGPLPQFSVDVPASLADAVRRGLARDPSARPRSAEDFGELLRSAQPQRTVEMVVLPTVSEAARVAAQQTVQSAAGRDHTSAVPADEPRSGVTRSARFAWAVTATAFLLLLLATGLTRLNDRAPAETAAAASAQDAPIADDATGGGAAADGADAGPVTTAPSEPPVELIRVPPVEQLAPKAARRVLEEAGFAVVVERRIDEDAQAKVVVDQTPEGGKERERQSTVTLRVAIPAPAPALSDYLTTDGSDPTRAQECPGILGLCLRGSVEEAIALLGQEDGRYGDSANLHRQWSIAEGAAFITVAADEVGSIHSMTAAINDVTGVRVALPEGLILGDSSMGDVAAALGPPHETREDSAENFNFYDYLYRTGPEGTVQYDFGYNAVVGSADDPGGFNAALGEQPVLSFTVDYPFDDFD